MCPTIRDKLVEKNLNSRLLGERKKIQKIKTEKRVPNQTHDGDLAKTFQPKPLPRVKQLRP